MGPDLTTMGLEDPSEIYRPKPPQFELDKAAENFRNYDNLEDDMSRVRDTYYEMHKNQTYQFACSQVSNNLETNSSGLVLNRTAKFL